MKFNREERRNLKMIQDMNTKYHTLHPYFELITQHMNQLIRGSTVKGILIRKGTTRSSSPSSPKKIEEVAEKLAQFDEEEEGKMKATVDPDEFDTDRNKSERKIMNTEEAISRIKVAKQNLPDCLQENKIKADRLLFVEA